VDNYKSDLTTENEADTRCAVHPTVVAKWRAEDHTPLCETCWWERWPATRLRIAEQRLVQGGLV
jgi:hypothetical protein